MPTAATPPSPGASFQGSVAYRFRKENCARKGIKTRRFDQEWQLLETGRDWLRVRGYRLVATHGPEGMDQGLDLYAGDSLGIRITADRSQWFIEVHPGASGVEAAGWKGWFGLEAWSACLGAPASFHDTRPHLTDSDRAAMLQRSWWLQPQVDYLRDHLDAIELACAPDRLESTLACLSDAQRTDSAVAER